MKPSRSLKFWGWRNDFLFERYTVSHVCPQQATKLLSVSSPYLSWDDKVGSTVKQRTWWEASGVNVPECLGECQVEAQRRREGKMGAERRELFPCHPTPHSLLCTLRMQVRSVSHIRHPGGGEARFPWGFLILRLRVWEHRALAVPHQALHLGAGPCTHRR